MSTIFKTRISQQEVQTPTLSATAVVADNFLTSSIQSESVASENINATIVQGEEIIANDLSTENIAISNDLSIGQDVIVPSGNVLVGRRGIVSFVDDGEEVDENGASGFPIYNGVPEVLNNSTVYNIGEIDKDIDLSNIRFGGNDNMVQTCEIWFSIPANTTRSTGDTYEITWPENVVWLDSTDGNAPAIVKGTEYRVVLRKENEQIVASIAYAIGEGSEIVSGNMMEGVARLDADNTFSAGNTFTGAVDMSGAQVTPPEGWNVADLTPEAIQQVVPMAWSEWTTAPTASGEKSLAIGENVKAETYGAVLLGFDSTQKGKYCTGVGTSTVATEFGTAIGYQTKTGGYLSTAVGAQSAATKRGCTAVGAKAYAEGECSTALGSYLTSFGAYSIAVGSGFIIYPSTSVTIGANFTETTPDGNITHTCTTEGTGSITIGAGANTLNNGDTESSNSVTIGCKALNQGADSVVIGASGSNTRDNNVVIGAAAKTTGLDSVAIGKEAKATDWRTTAVGRYSTASGTWSSAFGSYSLATAKNATVIGMGAKATAQNTTAVGYYATAADVGVIVFRSESSDGTYTQLYFSGANTPLANTYEDGEAMMGYVVRDKSGNVMTDAEGNAMVGTQKLSVLFPNNRGENAFTPAMLGLDDEWTPKPMFRPSDLDLPDIEPVEPEMEEYQPLPVYPIVEPEIEEI